MANTPFIFMDGFDIFGTSGTPAASVITVKYTTSSGTQITAGRIDGYAALLFSPFSAGFFGVTFPDTASFGIAFAIQVTSQSVAAQAILNLKDTGTSQIGLGIDAAQRLFVWRGTTATVLATAVAPLNPTTWYHVECEVAISDLTGEVEVRLNGNPTPVINITGVDTKTTINSFCNQFEFVGGAAFSNLGIAIDDIIVRQSTAATPTATWIGNTHIQTIFPNANGTTIQWTPSAGLNFQCVDENPANTSDYVSSSTIGQVDLYDFPALTGTMSTVYAVSQDNLSTLDAAGVNTFSSVFNDGVEYLSTALSPLTGSYTDTYTLWMDNPSTTAPWVQADINSGSFGIKVLT